MTDLLSAAKMALADLEGIMPEFDPSGDRTHPGWATIKELKIAIAVNEDNPQDDMPSDDGMADERRRERIIERYDNM